MTLKDIFDTPINEMWNVVSPFAIAYLICFGVVFIIALSFIVFVFIKIIKSHKEFEKEFENRRMNHFIERKQRGTRPPLR